MSHTHPVLDSDEHFVINPETRAITNSSSSKITLMQYDHNSERFSFEIPKLVENHDMSLCNSIEIHFTNTSQNRTLENSDVYVVDDMVPSRDDANVLVLTWLISEKATQLAGALSFQIKFACVEGDRVVYRWNTDVNNTVIVKNSMSSSDSIEEDYSDAITSLISKVSDMQAIVKGSTSIYAVDPHDFLANFRNGQYKDGDLCVILYDYESQESFPPDYESIQFFRGDIIEVCRNETENTFSWLGNIDGTKIHPVTGDFYWELVEWSRWDHTYARNDLYLITENPIEHDSPPKGNLVSHATGSTEVIANLFHPYAKVEETSEGAKITINDNFNGQTTATVKDGFSPTAKVEETAEGAKITITDKNGTTTVTVKNGGGGASARLSSVTLLASKWTGSDSLYSQVVTINGITPYSKVDLLPSVEQLAIFHNKDVAFVTENEDGVITVFAIGDKPTQDYTMQASITEVTV